MSAVQPARTRAAGTFAYLGLLFAACWTACLLLALGPGHEAFGPLAFAGALGSAVFPWCVGALAGAVAGRNRRGIALAVSLLTVAVLWLALRT